MTAAAGLQCGFGAPLGPVLDELRAIGITIIRIDLQESSQDDTAALAQEVLSAGLQPLCIIRRPEQMNVIPEGALIEVGNEPDLEHFGWTVEEYIEVGNACVKLALEQKRRIYLGVVSNLNPRGFKFLRKLPWDEWVGDGICCSIHRYPDGHSPQNPHDGSDTREEEVATLRGIVGNRPLACTEVGYHEVEWTPAEVADNMAWERRFFSEQGFEICSGYQLNDGPGDTTNDKFGFRRLGDNTWKPVAFAFANTEFPPLEGLVISLESDHGQFLSVAQTQVVNAHAQAAVAWEQFQVQMLDGDKCTLRSWQWHYLTAELDDTVNARATVVGPWETWTFEGLEDGRIAFKSFHGKYLTAELDGTVKARAEAIGPWERWTSDPPNWWVRPVIAPNPNRLHGGLTRNGRVVYDESGIQLFSGAGTRAVISRPRILMFCHAMELFSAWCHGREKEVTEQCIAIARHYAGVRVLDVLGYWDVAWKGREVTPISFINHSGQTVAATEHYWEKKEQFLSMLHKLGLRVMDDRGDMNSWTREQKLAHMHQNGDFYNGLSFGHEVLAGVWAANEGWQNGGNSIELCQEMLRSFESGAGWLPSLSGLSAPGGNSDPVRLQSCDPPMTDWEPEMPCSFVNWSATPATVLTIHGNRGHHEHIIEHYYNYGYDETMRKTNKVAFNTEPVGPGNGVSVGRVNDVELLCGLTVAALLTGQAWTYMSGFGVFWDGPIDSQPGFVEVARLPKFLPQDIATWPLVCHGGTRFYGKRILAAHDPTRCDHAIAADGRFAIAVHTQEHAGMPVTCERACEEFKVTNLVTGQVEQEGPMSAGEVYQHPGVVRLVTGRLA